LRIYALVALTGFLSLYAFRDWFVSLCGLIVLMAVVQHPDFPSGVGGVQGLNPWNALLICVMIGWHAARRREGLTWDMPRHITFMLLLYGIAVAISFVRLALDRGALPTLTTSYLFSEYLVNCFKWVVPGLLLFDGCRSRGRFHAGLTCILVVYVLLAIQVIKWMPTSDALTGSALNERALKIILREVGYHPVNMSMMLAGASWAIFASVPLLKKNWARLLGLVAGLSVTYGQALTGGRMGYATWGLVGISLGLLRWRKFLIVIPVGVLLVSIFLPGVVERMLKGFGERDVTGQEITNDQQVTSGRTLAWPYVLDKIGESPVFGFGRLAMERTGLSKRLKDELNEEFPHPHNAYLECLLDNGIVGLLMIVPFYLVVVKRSIQLLMARESRYYSAVGGTCTALVLALLFAAFGSQTFYPREGSVGMWAAIGLMLRMSILRQTAHERKRHATQVRRAPAMSVGSAVPAATG
jgi:hypothetical protein